jgi:hypothetical protein
MISPSDGSATHVRRKFMLEEIINDEIESNRKIALHSLRVNPKQFTQCELMLDNGRGGRCPLGAIADGLEIDIDYNANNISAYELVEAAIGTSYQFIYTLKDRYNFSYEQIADILEDLWEHGGTF